MDSPYTALQYLGLFVGIPLGVVIVIALLVLAPGWTRTARRGGSTAWNGEPLWIGARAQEGSRASIEDRGGASANW